MEVRRLRLGMIGGGRGAFIGGVHRMAARLDDRYALVAGALSSDPERARRSGEDLGLDPARSYGSIDELIAGERGRPDGVEVVAIVTPNHVHHGAARACLDAGFHVICDKPMTTTVAEARDLCEAAEAAGRVLAVTYNYSGYPLVRAARELVRAGDLGSVHRVQVEYLQDWLLEPLEAAGNKQASWRTDPARSGPAGCLGDIGTHAFHLAEFVSGLEVRRVAGTVTTHVPGRRVDDDAQVLLQFGDGGAWGGSDLPVAISRQAGSRPGGGGAAPASGSLWASQVATGHENGLRLRIYGARAGLEWRQEVPNELRLAPFGEPVRVLTRGGPGTGTLSAAATRVPPGHPEGYIEAFAQLYRDAADRITAVARGETPPAAALLVPSGEHGLRGVKFVHAVLESHAGGMKWVDL